MVRTTSGDIETTVCRDLLRRVEPADRARWPGARIPLTPIVHQMISVGPIPLFDGTEGEIAYPIVRDVDTNMYERQHGGDMEVGSYAHRPIIVSPDDIPSNEAAVLSPTEMPFTQDDFDPQLAQALELMPELLGDESVGIRYAINGLISMTPDGHPALGECPEVPGLWSVAASWIKEGPGICRAVAEWMTGTVPEIDIHEADISRFYGHQRTTAHVTARAREGFNKMYGIVHPAEQWESGRPLRLSPVYDRERDLGAVFFETAGWERPNWYASNEHLLERYAGRLMARDRPNGNRAGGRRSSTPSTWPCASPARCSTCPRSRCFDITGPGALDAVQSMAVAQLDVPPGRVVYTSLLDANGGFRADLTMMRLGADRFRVVTGGATGMMDKKWIAGQLPADGRAQLADLTSAWATLRALGPAGQGRACSRSPPRTCPRPASRSPPAREIEIAGVTVLASRISYVGELGWELYVPIEAGRRGLGRGLGGGPAPRPDPGGHRRVRHHRPAGEGLPGLRRRAGSGLQPGRGGHDPAPGQGPVVHRQGRLPAAAGGPAVRGAVHADRGRSHLGRRPSCGTCSAASRCSPPAGEPLTDERGRPSYVTSAGSGPSVGKHLLLAYLPAGQAREGNRLAVEYLAEQYPVTVAVAGSRPLFDPDNTRVRS